MEAMKNEERSNVFEIENILKKFNLDGGDDEVKGQRWRAEVHYSVVDDYEFVQVMDHYCFKAFSPHEYKIFCEDDDGYLDGTLRFYCEGDDVNNRQDLNDGETSNEIIFIRQWEFMEHDDWNEDEIYAHIVCEVSYQEPFFFFLQCDQPPPTAKAEKIIKTYIKEMYSPSALVSTIDGKIE